MTTERDPGTRIVLSWLREDAHENAESLLLRALDEVDTTPQRGRFWPARRFIDMNTFAKLAIAAAAVVVVAVAAVQFLPRRDRAGCATDPDALADGEPDARISVLPTTRSARARPLCPESGAVRRPRSRCPRVGPAAATTVVKEKELADVGWGGSRSSHSRLSPTRAQPQARSCPLTGRCRASSTRSMPRSARTRPSPTSRSAAARPSGSSSCRRQASGTSSAEPATRVCSRSGQVPPSRAIWALYPGARGLVHALDIDGKLVIFNGVIGPEASASDLAELEAVIASTQIGP